MIPPDLGVAVHKLHSPERVCRSCHARLLPLQPGLLATATKAVQAGDFSEPTLLEWAGKFVSNSFKLLANLASARTDADTLTTFLLCIARAFETTTGVCVE